jgi:hypothetical protein
MTGRGNLNEAERAELERLRAMERRMHNLARTVEHRRVEWVGRSEFEQALNGDAVTVPRPNSSNDPSAPPLVRRRPIGGTP